MMISCLYLDLSMSVPLDTDCCDIGHLITSDVDEIVCSLLHSVHDCIIKLLSEGSSTPGAHSCTLQSMTLCPSRGHDFLSCGILCFSFPKPLPVPCAPDTVAPSSPPVTPCSLLAVKGQRKTVPQSLSLSHIRTYTPSLTHTHIRTYTPSLSHTHVPRSRS